MKKYIAKVKGFIWYDLRFLEKIFYWKTNKYLSKYYCKPENSIRSKQKTIIYMLDGKCYSGGITDVIKGIISMFKLSKELGFDFKINFKFPFKLTDYLQPNTYNWTIDSRDISYNPKISSPLWLYSVHNSFGKTHEFEIEFQRKVIKRFLAKNQSASQIHIYSNSDWAQGREYSTFFNELFTPSESLLNVINFHKNQLGDNYVSMTFRFQQLLGDFIEASSGTDQTTKVLDLMKKSGRLNNDAISDYGIMQLRALLGDFRNKNISTPLNETSKIHLVERCINKITEIHSKLPKNTKILITADSDFFLNKVSELDFVYAITKKNLVPNISKDALYDTFLKAYVDMLMISYAKKIFLLTTGPMYKSGFAKNASLINNNEYEEINW